MTGIVLSILSGLIKLLMDPELDGVRPASPILYTRGACYMWFNRHLNTTDLPKWHSPYGHSSSASEYPAKNYFAMCDN